MILSRVPAAFVALCAAAVLFTSCTSGAGSPSSTPPSSAPRSSATPASSAPAVAVPSSLGRLHETTSTCPLMTRTFVQGTVGMRLDRVTVLRGDHSATGCRFYPLSHPTAQCDATCLRNEHLTGPNQPAVEIVQQQYSSAKAAHNAFVRTARAGTNPQQFPLTSAATAVCFQTDFYPPDKGQDWACGFSKGPTAVVVRTVVTSPALNAFGVAKKAFSAL